MPARRHVPDLGYADIERQMRPIIVKQPNAAPLSMTAPRQARPPCPKFSDLRNVPACDCRPNPRILELSRQGLGCRRGRLDQAVSGTPWSSAMKSLTTIALAAALFAGATTASAQNATPTTKVAPSPSNINKSNSSGKPSGSEASSAAAGHSARVSGAGKFCRPKAANRLDCRYASMTACQKHNKSNSLHCV